MTTDTPTPAKKKALYKFNWTSGGYNQVYAFTKAGARKEIKKQFDGCGLTLAEHTLTRVKDTKAFWANYPIFD